MNDELLTDSIHTLDRRLQIAIDRALAPLALTGAQWRVLSAALAAPGASGADLARACRMTPQSMQTLIAALEADGLVVRQPHPVHGRSQQLYVANAGEVRHAEGARAVAQVEERLLAGFTLDERNAFAELLSRALATFSRD